jgi:deazaflavin-dependent oxidoreductase (nitroreductase family)
MTALNDYNAKLIDDFRANDGRLQGDFAGAPIVLITHTGAKSGKQRTNPIAYTRDGDNVVIIASKGGAPTHPDWYFNLVANPVVTVELPGETYQAHARVATGDERSRLFTAQAAILPTFKDYQDNTTRELPVIVLERI